MKNGRMQALVREFELDFVSDVLGLDSLHYGIWKPEDPLTLEGLSTAQRRYTEKLLAFVPEDSRTLLDVGSGLGDNTRALAREGLHVTALSPVPSHERCYPTDDPRVAFHGSTLEAFESEDRYDVVLMSESSNYFCFRMAFDRFDELLRPGGHILLSAIFKTDDTSAYETTHRYSDYMAHARTKGYEVVRDEDVTEHVLPTLTLGRELLKPIVATADLATRYYGTLCRSFKWRVVSFLGRHLFADMQAPLAFWEDTKDTLDPERFRRELMYRFILLRRGGEVQEAPSRTEAMHAATSA